ncbi:MAG: nuclear transport factor 2 family protein [Pseudomonadota bacterium]
MTSAVISPVTETTLAAFSAAWNAHDIDALMSFMHDDCEFLTPAGPDACGTRHVGRDAVRRAFEGVWQAMPDAHWHNGRYIVQGDLAFSLWTFTGTTADGARTEVDGVDVFTLKNGKIQTKNAFRKTRPTRSSS